ncbi:MAG: hypothetical protein QXU18_08465 [Thermoplasmatales archaeon]
MTRNESRNFGFVSGIIRVPVPASLFTTGIVLTFGYATQLIYTVGDTRQLTPIFAGLIIGTIIFSLVGTLIKFTRKNLLSLTLLSGIFLIAAFAIIYVNSLVISNSNLFLIAFLIGSPAMAVSQLVGSLVQPISTLRRAIFGSVQAVLIITFIFVYALEYELRGQVALYIGPLIFLIISLLYLALIKIV